MSLKRTSKKCRLSYILLAVLGMAVIIATCMVHELDQHLAEITEYRGREAATEVITAAVDRTMSRCGDGPLYILERDESGRVLSAQLDAAAANRLKNLLTEETESGLEKLGDEGISIPIGTLLGIPVFSGRKASFEIGVQQLGAVKTELTSDLETAGINQTRLTVMVTVTVEIRAILPDGHTDITVTEDHILNDSMIVGDIPQAYFAAEK